MALPLSIRFICVGYLKCTAEPNHNLTHLFLASNVDQLFGPNLFWTLLVFCFLIVDFCTLEKSKLFCECQIKINNGVFTFSIYGVLTFAIVSPAKYTTTINSCNNAINILGAKCV